MRYKCARAKCILRVFTPLSSPTSSQLMFSDLLHNNTSLHHSLLHVTSSRVEQALRSAALRTLHLQQSVCMRYACTRHFPVASIMSQSTAHISLPRHCPLLLLCLDLFVWDCARHIHIYAYPSHRTGVYIGVNRENKTIDLYTFSTGKSSLFTCTHNFRLKYMGVFLFF